MAITKLITVTVHFDAIEFTGEGVVTLKKAGEEIYRQEMQSEQRLSVVLHENHSLTLNVSNTGDL